MFVSHVGRLVNVGCLHGCLVGLFVGGLVWWVVGCRGWLRCCSVALWICLGAVGSSHHWVHLWLWGGLRDNNVFFTHSTYHKASTHLAFIYLYISCLFMIDVPLWFFVVFQASIILNQHYSTTTTNNQHQAKGNQQESRITNTSQNLSTFISKHQHWIWLPKHWINTKTHHHRLTKP